MEVTDTQIAALETALRDEVRKLAEDAARWYLDGNTDEETYRRVLKGIEDGDPRVLDSLPWLDLDNDDNLPEWGELFYDVASRIVGDYPESDALMATLEDKYGEIIGVCYADEVLFDKIEAICRYHLGEE
jgi:hypothetical protein